MGVILDQVVAPLLGRYDLSFYALRRLALRPYFS
jgi:hypothetical protein